LTRSSRQPRAVSSRPRPIDSHSAGFVASPARLNTRGSKRSTADPRTRRGARPEQRQRMPRTINDNSAIVTRRRVAPWFQGVTDKSTSTTNHPRSPPTVCGTGARGQPRPSNRRTAATSRCRRPLLPPPPPRHAFPRVHVGEP
jgi:hypothetical protein